MGTKYGINHNELTIFVFAVAKTILPVKRQLRRKNRRSSNSHLLNYYYYSGVRYQFYW